MSIEKNEGLIQSGLLFLKQWYQQHLEGVLMYCLPSQSQSHLTQKSKLLRDKCVTVDKRGLVSVEWCTAVKIFIFAERMLVRSSVKSGGNFVWKKAVNHYTFVYKISHEQHQVQNFIEHYSIFL